ncbi:MAG: terminase [Cellulomonadaceae bacterium]
MTSNDTPTKRRAPDGLKARGKRFWTACISDFDFSSSEVVLLEEACRVLDRLDQLNAAITRDGPMVAGSQGQQVVNPALTEARGQQLALHKLIAALALPDDDGQTVPTGRSMSASAAATARWNAPAGRALRGVK